MQHIFIHIQTKALLLKVKFLVYLRDWDVCKSTIPYFSLGLLMLYTLALSHLEVISSDAMREANKGGNNFKLATSCEVETINKVIFYKS